MFKKPFKIKSNTQVKASERKTFKDLLLRTFPNFLEVEVNEFLGKKEVLNSIKLVTHDNHVVHVYTVQKRPMFFETEGILFPTVYFLWKFPKLIPVFTTHPNVMSFISSGADLMLPGVLTPPAQSGLPKYGNLSENAQAYVNFSNNRAAVAVGSTAQSSSSMMLSNGKGKCIIIHHFHGDKLCTLEGLSNLPIPNMGPIEWLQLKSYDEDFPELGKSTVPQGNNQNEHVCDNLNNQNPDGDNLADNNKEEKNETGIIESDDDGNMDDLLHQSFFTAIKYSKTLSLPILTSNFYKLQMIPSCPNKTLDIKKTSYKKLKPFLEKMCQDGVITVKEIKKGVEAITEINTNHPQFAEFYLTPENRPRKENEEPENPYATSVTESYVVTPAVLPIFNPEGLRKGDTVLKADVRKYLVKYVKENNCQDSENKRLVKPVKALVPICKTESPVTWEELIEKVCDSMKSSYKVTSGTEEVINKGKVSPINISVSVRSGNKKVTLIDNLELFGINIGEFAKECQHGVAASTSVSIPPGKKCDQLLVQGNQVLFVYNLLTDKYKIPKKYIRGLENAPKKKK